MKTNGIIILDGPDGVGKTTLANELVKSHHFEYVHLSKPETGKAWDEHAAALLAAVQSSAGRPVVIDRHFMSEAIYGRIYRDGSEYPHTARHVDRLLHRFGALRVICAPPVEYVREMFGVLKQVRKEMFDDNMDLIAQKYLEVWEGRPANFSIDAPSGSADYLEQLANNGGVADTRGWEHYDVTQHQGDDAVQRYAQYLVNKMKDELLVNEKLVGNAAPFNPLDVTLRCVTGRVSLNAIWLVGDVQNVPSNERTFPFFSNDNSSRYLAEKLAELNVSESNLVIFNANDPDAMPILGWLYLQQKKGRSPRRLIAMGRMAEQTLDRQGIIYHASTRHPQHARRFNYRDSSFLLSLNSAITGVQQ